MDALKINPASAGSSPSALSSSSSAGASPEQAAPTEGGGGDAATGGATDGRRDPALPTGWNLLTQAADRVLFAVYLIIITVFIATFFGGAAVNDTA